MLNFIAETSHPANLFGGLIVLIVIAAVAVAALNLLKSRSSKQAAPSTYPFQRRKYLLSAAERSFYEVFRRVADGQFNLFPKVRLADIVYVQRGTGSYQSHFNRIQSKHVDFLLCDLEQIAPIAVIELDDSSHDAQERKTRDQIVDAICEAAGLRVIHIQAQRSYSPESLRAMLQPFTTSHV